MKLKHTKSLARRLLPALLLAVSATAAAALPPL